MHTYCQWMSRKPPGLGFLQAKDWDCLDLEKQLVEGLARERRWVMGKDSVMVIQMAVRGCQEDSGMASQEAV